MSLQSVVDFTVAASKDPALVAEIEKQLKGKSPEEAAKAYADLGKKKGYDFTPAEASETRSQVMRTSQLSEADLDKVAGGAGAAGTGEWTTYGISQSVAAMMGVPVVGGIVGQGVGDAFATWVNGGSFNDGMNSMANGMVTALNDTKQAVQDFFSSW